MSRASVKRGAHTGGRRFSEDRPGDVARAATLILGIREMLQVRGPMPSDELRERLCVASAARWRVTIRSLIREGALSSSTAGVIQLAEAA